MKIIEAKAKISCTAIVTLQLDDSDSISDIQDITDIQDVTDIEILEIITEK